MNVILDNILPIAIIFGVMLLLNGVGLLVRKSQKPFARVIRRLLLPVELILIVLLTVLMILWKATMNEMLIVILASLVLAFL